MAIVAPARALKSASLKLPGAKRLGGQIIDASATTWVLASAGPYRAMRSPKMRVGAYRGDA
jgi:hypothetical protein